MLKFSTGEIIIDDIMWRLHRIKPFAASGKDMEPVINIGYTLADASQHTKLSTGGERINVFRSTMEDEILRNNFLATNHEANIMSELTHMIGSVTKHDSRGS